MSSQSGAASTFTYHWYVCVYVCACVCVRVYAIDDQSSFYCSHNEEVRVITAEHKALMFTYHWYCVCVCVCVCVCTPSVDPMIKVAATAVATVGRYESSQLSTWCCFNVHLPLVHVYVCMRVCMYHL